MRPRRAVEKLPSVPTTIYRTISVDGPKVFYREAGNPKAPAVLLLHGFPTSSHMYRELIPALANRYHVVAPDLPGFGFTEAPDRKTFKYSFDHLAEVIERFTEVLGLSRYALYVFDYGAPVGFRLAMNHPERIAALISQNGNAYEEGLSEGWNPIQAYWKEPSPKNREALRRLPDAGGHAMAAHAWRGEPRTAVARCLDPRLCAPRPARQ
jgi:pimeloyl-ACP methyl ester carboxylesterase